MIADEKIGFLLLGHAQAGIGAGLIVVLRNVAALLVEVFSREEHAVLRSDLEFDLSRELEMVEIIVRAITVVRAIVAVERVGEIAEPSELRSALDPFAVAAIFGAGADPEPVLLE